MVEKNPSHFKWISEMVSTFEHLEYFSFSSMDIPLTQMIIKEVEKADRKIEIGVTKELFENPNFKKYIQSLKQQTPLLATFKSTL